MTQIIARIWRGAVAVTDGDAYSQYMQDTGLMGYAATRGNRGVWMLRRTIKDKTEFVMFTLWDSLEAIKSFAGENPEKAVFYPEDAHYLIERDDYASHFEVVTHVSPSSTCPARRRSLSTGPFAAIKGLTALYLAAAAATLVFVALARNHKALVNSEAWTHAVIVFAFATLFVGVARRAEKGSPRAYLRLRVISLVIPLVSVVLVAIPGLPTWMKVEQGVSALALAAVALLARRPSG